MVGSGMKELRKCFGMRQEELAAEIGVHRVTVTRWEIEDAQIPDDIASRVLQAVNSKEVLDRIILRRRRRQVANRLTRFGSKTKRIKDEVEKAIERMAVSTGGQEKGQA